MTNLRFYCDYSQFQVSVFGILSPTSVRRYVLLRLGFHLAPMLLGFVLGSRFEENFRRAMLIARGDLSVFVTRPISAVFVALCVMLIASQIYFRLRRSDRDRTAPAAAPAE